MQWFSSQQYSELYDSGSHMGAYFWCLLSKIMNKKVERTDETNQWEKVEMWLLLGGSELTEKQRRGQLEFWKCSPPSKNIPEEKFPNPEDRPKLNYQSSVRAE